MHFGVLLVVHQNDKGIERDIGCSITRDGRDTPFEKVCDADHTGGDMAKSRPPAAAEWMRWVAPVATALVAVVRILWPGSNICR